MNIDEVVLQFNRELDRRLGLGPQHMAGVVSTDPAYQQAVETADLLAGMNLDRNAEPRSGLADRWKRQTRKLDARVRAKPVLNPRCIWIAAIAIMLILLGLFHQPVFAAVERFFGYIYVPDMGFVPIGSTLVLQQPILQEHDGASLTITQAVSTAEKTTVMLEFSGVATPGDGASLETGTGSTLVVAFWEYVPNTKGSHGLKLNFPPLPAGTTQTTLVLPAGWHLPMNWIPADQSSLTDVQAVPYPLQATGTASSSVLCAEKNGLKVCVKAAVAEPDDTSVLVESMPTNPALRPNWLLGFVWRIDADRITLQDEQGNIYPIDNRIPPSEGLLHFPPIVKAGRLTLTIPALPADVDIPDQSITVDLGEDPQPNTTVPVDATIQILGSSVHFSQGTLEGSAPGSLRLLLNADEPIQAVDGITPFSVEIGRPDKIDDLYGSGSFDGSQDIHIELMQGGQKVTGKLFIPVVSATVLVNGPFEFTFNLADLPAQPPTPIAANPDTFQPAASSTPVSMDGYSYSEAAFQSGDLLYVIWNGDQSDLYRYHPGSGTAPEHFMTLPGNVSSLSLHQDLLGLDYLAGTYDANTNSTTPALYTLRFSDPAPRPLQLSTQGSIFWPTWSADGRFVAFGIQLPNPGEYTSRIGWVDLGCRDAGKCAVNLLDAPLEYQLNAPQFSPRGDWLAINGVDLTYGAGEIYLLQLDQNGNAGPLQNVTNTGQVYDDSVHWIDGNRLVWKCIPTTGDLRYGICSQGITSSQKSPVILYEPNDNFFFGFSNSGNYFWTNMIDRTVAHGNLLHLHNLAGEDHFLIEAPIIAIDAGRSVFSTDERWLAYATSESVDALADKLHIASTLTGEDQIVYTGSPALGWVGWVP
jgi:hypothetical protein